ncbi:MAG: CBS domain-containing protein [Actinomycetota bacterium]
MSPRAAWRLESLGFTEVYDYGPGKQNWLAAGLEVEGERADLVRAGHVARADAPTCLLDDRVGDVRAGLEGTGFDTCIVVNEERVVFGVLRPKQLEGDDDRTAEKAMAPGPSTFRPHVSAADLGEYMIRHDLANAPITTGEGVLVGLLLREDASRVALEKHQEHEHGE